jgi:hypothetical protein
VIIGWPYSPLYYGARRLVAAGSHTSSTSATWALTAKRAPSGNGSRARPKGGALRVEHAAGVVTTAPSATPQALSELALLCRPNGY